MKAFSKIVAKVKKEKSVATIILAIFLLLAIVLGVIVIAGLILLWGLNLMGFDVPYTFKTILGAAIVLLSLRPSGVFNNKKE